MRGARPVESSISRGGIRGNPRYRPHLRRPAARGTPDRDVSGRPGGDTQPDRRSEHPGARALVRQRGSAVRRGVLRSAKRNPAAGRRARISSATCEVRGRPSAGTRSWRGILRWLCSSTRPGRWTLRSASGCPPSTRAPASTPSSISASSPSISAARHQAFVISPPCADSPSRSIPRSSSSARAVGSSLTKTSAFVLLTARVYRAPHFIAMSCCAWHRFGTPSGATSFEGGRQ